jgi:hypothetical protein
MDRVIQGRDSIPIIISESDARTRPFAPGYAADDLPESLIENGEVVSVDEAISTYLRFNRSNQNSDNRTSRYERSRQYQYPRILESDRQFQEQYSLTTVTLTRKIDPLSETDELLTPWELDARLNGGSVRGAIGDALRYQLRDFDWEWVGVTTPEELSGAPEEHLHLWIDDPDNIVTTDFFDTAWQRHIDNCTTVPDERGRAIEVATDPSLVDYVPEETASIMTHSEAVEVRPTDSAYSVAKQLPDLIVGDYYSEDHDNPPDTLLEGAAAGWAVTHEWYRTSRGLPDL